MKTATDVNEFARDFDCSAATIGNFDGVHLGHRKILAELRAEADRRQCPAIVITFEPHPSAVLYPQRGVNRLTSPETKLKLLEECGMDGVLAIPFTLEFAGKGPRAFVEEVLHPLGVKKLFLGHDFSFGSGRAGTVASLQKEGKLLGFEVTEIPEVTMDGLKVRSTTIRNLLAEGRVGQAARLMDRYHSVTGKVITGAGRGRKLNFPTANLGEPAETVPEHGVYAAKVLWNGHLLNGATHVGYIPTFDVEVPGIETHIFDFDKQITGDPLEVFFIKHLRDTVRFNNAEELKEQIRIDCEDARKALADETEKAYLP